MLDSPLNGQEVGQDTLVVGGDRAPEVKNRHKEGKKCTFKILWTKAPSKDKEGQYSHLMNDVGHNLREKIGTYQGR